MLYSYSLCISITTFMHLVDFQHQCLHELSMPTEYLRTMCWRNVSRSHPFPKGGGGGCCGPGGGKGPNNLDSISVHQDSKQLVWRPKSETSAVVHTTTTQLPHSVFYS